MTLHSSDTEPSAPACSQKNWAVSFKRIKHLTDEEGATLLSNHAAIAQLGKRQTEDLEVPNSILGHGNFLKPRRSFSVEGRHEKKMML